MLTQVTALMLKVFTVAGYSLFCSGDSPRWFGNFSGIILLRRWDNFFVLTWLGVNTPDTGVREVLVGLVFL